MRSLGKHHAKTNEPGPLRLDRPIIVELNGSLTATEAIKLLAKHPDVALVEHDHIGDGGLVPNDPSYGLQYYHQKIQSESAGIFPPAAAALWWPCSIPGWRRSANSRIASCPGIIM